MVCYQITHLPITQSVIAGLVPEVQGTTQEVAKAKCRAASDLVSVYQRSMRTKLIVYEWLRSAVRV